MSRFIKAKLKSDSESDLELDSEAKSKSNTKLMAKLLILILILNKTFTLDNVYSYIFVDFEQVILLPIAGHIKPFLFMPIFLREQFFS